MKKIKFLIGFALLCIGLSSCGFVRYVEYPNDENQEKIENQKALYIDRLNSISNEDNYYEEELRLYKVYLNNAINEIMECEDITVLEEVYLKNKNIIEEIKTIQDYLLDERNALEDYKAIKISEIKDYCVLTDYREAEQKQIEVYLGEYETKINEQINYDDIDDVVRDFKITVYSLKTDRELYQEELNELISFSCNEIKYYKNISDYRSNEAEIVQSLLTSFETVVATAQTKELVYEFTESYKSMLNSIKTDSQLYEEERLSLIEECYEEMMTLVDLTGFPAEEYEKYLLYCDEVKTEMTGLATKEEVRQKLNAEKINLYIIGAQNNDEESLSYYQIILSENLSYYLNVNLYRKEQQTEISGIIRTYSSLIRQQETYEETVLCLETAHNLLDEVLNNEEMWAQEDADFYNRLQSLYGDNVLSAPATLTEANDYYELASIIDYYCFYQLNANSFVRDIFRVKLNWQYRDALYEKNEVYWYCELLNGAVGLDTYFDINPEYLVIKLIPYDFASVSNFSDFNFISKYDYQNNYSGNAGSIRTEDFDDFGYKAYEKTVVVWNSQQLWYALEHDYLPLCVENSSAEYLLNYAKRILRQIIQNDMTNEEKIYRIFSWVSDNVQYDTLAYGYNNSSDMDLYPDENYSLLKSLHIEGALLEGLAVCSGYAKVYLLLLRIEGIEAVKVIARNSLMKGLNTINSRDYGGGGFGFHEFVYIHMNGKWYYSDAERSCLENNYALHSVIYLMLSPFSQDYGFTVMYPEIDLADSMYAEIYNNIRIYDYSCTDTSNYADIIQSFSNSNTIQSEISFILFNDFEEYVLELIKYPNLNYTTHTKYLSDNKIIEFIVYIDS